MGERKGQNKYYPPDFDHKKHFSLNSYHGVHALRERGAKASEGILIIRFEMPFNCWCLTCNKPIGMGVRYNSEKTKVGQFYSTPIFQFKMQCHLCAGDIVIQTDPEHFQYLIISGARRREQRYDPTEIGLPELSDSRTKDRLASDPMFHLEYANKDEEKVSAAKPSLRKILKSKDDLFDDFKQNQLARKRFRDEKKLLNEKQNRLDNLAKKLCLAGSDITLLPISERDTEAARFHLKTFDLLCILRSMKDSSIDVSTTAVERRKAALIRNLRAKAMRKPVSRYLAFAQGFVSKKPNVKMEAKIESSVTMPSLVSEQYCSSEDD